MFEYLVYFFNLFAGGFEIFGLKVWDFSAPFSYFEIFSTAFVICGGFYLIYLILANKAKKLDSSSKDSKDKK